MCLLLTAVVLCFTGCGGGAGGNPADVPVGNGAEYTGSPEFVTSEDGADLLMKKGQYEAIDFEIFCESTNHFLLQIFKDTDSELPLDYFTRGYIEGINWIYDDMSSNSYYYGMRSDWLTTKEAVLSKLPVTGQIILHLENENHPERNLIVKYPEEYTTQLRDWIEAWTPPSN